MNTPITLQSILAAPRIKAAWHRVRSNRGAAGEDLLTIAELEPRFERLWPAIADTILNGTYRPAPLRPVRIPKPSGGTRQLSIPSVIDRIIQQCLSAAISERWESRFGNASFAYRPGIGPSQAIGAALHHAASLPNPFALRLDIRDFFDTVPHPLVSRVLEQTPCDPAVQRLALDAVSTPSATCTGLNLRSAGLPQGSPLSPVLSNAVLLPFDQAFQTANIPLLRYADDMLILTPDEASAHAAHHLASETLAPLGLALHPDKTHLTPLADASFLGIGFQRYPEGWGRSLPTETLSACREHLRRMEDSARPPSDPAPFLRQWCAYFLPTPQDHGRHTGFLHDLAASFQLPLPAPGKTHTSPPQGFAYDGSPSSRRVRSPGWAALHLLRTIRIGLNFRRKGFLPVPQGIHLNIFGHRIHFRF